MCFLKVPLACLGSMAAAVQPNGLGNSLKTFYKTFSTSCRHQSVDEKDFEEQVAQCRKVRSGVGV